MQLFINFIIHQIEVSTMKKGWQQFKLLDLFPKSIFWDVNPNALDWKEDADFIIPRVIQRYGVNEDYLYNLDLIYSKVAVLHFALNSNEIFANNEGIETAARHYNIQPNRFKRYIPM